MLAVALLCLAALAAAQMPRMCANISLIEIQTHYACAVPSNMNELQYNNGSTGVCTVFGYDSIKINCLSVGSALWESN